MPSPEPPITPETHPPTAPLDDVLPGAGRVVPVGAPPQDEALGVPVAEETEHPMAPFTPPPDTPIGDPLPGAGRIVPVGDPPEDEALGVPLDADDEPRQ